MNLYEIRMKLKLPVFRLADFCRVINKPKGIAAVYLNRMLRKGLVNHVKKGYYSITDDPFVTSSNIAENSYISFNSGLYLHGAVTQVPSRIQLVSQKRFSLPSAEFVVFPKDKIFGYSRKDDIRVGELEKVVADCLYKQRCCNIHYLPDAIRRCNPEKLMGYAKRMNMATFKRVGYMLELAGYKLDAKVKGVHIFNPAGKNKGEYNARWKIYVNEVLK